MISLISAPLRIVAKGFTESARAVSAAGGEFMWPLAAGMLLGSMYLVVRYLDEEEGER